MRKLYCAGCDHSRIKKGQRTVDSTFGVVQSRKAGYNVMCRDIGAIRPRIR